MNPPQPRPPRLQLSLGDTCRLVALLAVLFACLAPLREARGDVLGLVVVCEGFLTPWVLVMAVNVFLRRGVLRLWLNWFLIGLPIAFLIGEMVFIAILITWSSLDRRMAVIAWAIAAGLASALGWQLLRLWKRLVPDRCPACGRRRVFPDMRPLSDCRLGALMVGRCVGCGARFERWLRGTWQSVEPRTRPMQAAAAQRTPLAESAGDR